MNYDLLLLVVFYIFLLIIFKIFRKKFEVQGKVFVLYKTKIGIKLMDKIAKKFPKSLNILGYISVAIGFLGMLVTTVFIVFMTYKFLFVPKTQAALAPLLPGISVSDQLPILSFWHWIIAILIVATIHEFSHGVFARLRNIKIKSSGFAFLGPILAAFVEPDEKQLKKKPVKDQLFVFSAGPFSNIILGIIILLVMGLVLSPIANSVTEVNGIIIGEINSSLPINNSGLKSGMILQEVNGNKINESSVLSNILEAKKPGEVLNFKANDSYYNVTLSSNPENNTKAILGISFSNYKIELKEKFKPYSILYKIFSWFGMLLFWLFNITVGVGLFNLLPLGPVDGGRMFNSALIYFTKDEKKSLRILTTVSLIILALILINMYPFFLRLFKFILSPFI